MSQWTHVSGCIRIDGLPEDTKEIDDWFTRIVQSVPILRAAHLLIEVEYGARYMLIAEDGKVERVALATKADS